MWPRRKLSKEASIRNLARAASLNKIRRLSHRARRKHDVAGAVARRRLWVSAVAILVLVLWRPLWRSTDAARWIGILGFAVWASFQVPVGIASVVAAKASTASGTLIHIGAIATQMYLQRGTFNLRVFFSEVGFGNPAGFPHLYLASCRRLSVHVTVPAAVIPRAALALVRRVMRRFSWAVAPLESLRRRTTWSSAPVLRRSTAHDDRPTARDRWKRSISFAAASRRLLMAPQFGVLHIEHVELDGVAVSLETLKGELNLCAYSRLMAEKSVRLGLGIPLGTAHENPPPNVLMCEVVRASLHSSRYVFARTKLETNRDEWTCLRTRPNSSRRLTSARPALTPPPPSPQVLAQGRPPHPQ